MSHSVNLTEGNPLRQIARFSVPILLSGLLQLLYSTADMIILGRFCSLESFSAVGSTGSILFAILGILMGITSGAGVISAQYFGAGNEEKLRKSIAMSFIVGFFSAIAITAISIPLTDDILRAMKFSPDTFDHAKTYLFCIFGGTIATVFYNTIFAQSRSIGDSLTPLIWLFVSSILNILFNLLFVIAFNMEVVGVGIATILATAISAIGALISIRRKHPVMRLHHEDWKLNWHIIFSQIRTGIPMGFQFFLTALGIIIRQSAVNTLGTGAMAAWTAATRLEAIATFPLFMISHAIVTYAAQNLGAGKIARLREGVCASMKICAFYSVAACALALLLYRPITHLFISNLSEEIFSYVRAYVWATGPFYIPLTMILIYRSSLQGMNYQTVPFVGGIVELIARGFFAFPLLHAHGFYGLVFTEAIAWTSTGLLDFFYYRIVCRHLDKKQHNIV